MSKTFELHLYGQWVSQIRWNSNFEKTPLLQLLETAPVNTKIPITQEVVDRLQEAVVETTKKTDGEFSDFWTYWEFAHLVQQSVYADGGGEINYLIYNP